MILQLPRSSSRTFCGFMSLWSSPAAWIDDSPWRVWLSTAATRAGGVGSSSMASARLPLASSIAIQGVASSLTP